MKNINIDSPININPKKEKNISKLLQNQEVSYIKEIKKLLEEETQSKKIKDLEIILIYFQIGRAHV